MSVANGNWVKLGKHGPDPVSLGPWPSVGRRRGPFRSSFVSSLPFLLLSGSRAVLCVCVCVSDGPTGGSTGRGKRKNWVRPAKPSNYPLKPSKTR